jgi:curli biogenesis system outer membrane secretion channel CsgG
MKKLIALAFCLALFAGYLPALAEKPVLAVAEFRNQATGVYWWNRDVGWELTGMLTNELVATGAFTAVERNKLEHVLAEQDLADYGRVKPGTGAKIGELTGAEYIVLATVTSFEEKAASTGGRISFRGVGVGGKKKEAYIAVDLRVVNSTTGEIEFVRSVEARATSKGGSVSLHRGGFGGSLGSEKNTPVGKAIRGIVIEITDYLECAMVLQDGCLAEYDAKEDRRRQRTRDSIKLD